MTNGTVDPGLHVVKPDAVDFGDMFGQDAITILAQQLVRSGVRLNKKSVKALVFLDLYLGQEDGKELTGLVMSYKIHQMQNASKHFLGAIQAVGLKELWSKINLNLGGK